MDEPDKGAPAAPDPFAEPFDVPEDDAEPDNSLRDEIGAFIADARELVQAEIDYNRARLRANLTLGKRVAGLFGIGAVLVVAGLIALILGLLLIADHYLGPIWATVIVAGGTLGLAGLLLSLGLRNAKRLPLDGEDE